MVLICETIGTLGRALIGGTRKPRLLLSENLNFRSYTIIYFVSMPIFMGFSNGLNLIPDLHT
jgi:hypothetical protein